MPASVSTWNLSPGCKQRRKPSQFSFPLIRSYRHSRQLNLDSQTDQGGSTTSRKRRSDWQVLEEKVGANYKNRYVWSPSYIDALVTRDRDTDANGTLDERLFAQHDGNFNVTAITTTSGTVQERYTPDPFGVVTFRDASGSTISASAKDWVFLHQGGQADILGHYDFRNRILSPTLGRWLTNDPLGFDAGDNNFYRYVGNDPGNGLDYLGLFTLGNSGSAGSLAGGSESELGEAQMEAPKLVVEDRGPSSHQGYHTHWIRYNIVTPKGYKKEAINGWIICENRVTWGVKFHKDGNEFPYKGPLRTYRWYTAIRVEKGEVNGGKNQAPMQFGATPGSEGVVERVKSVAFYSDSRYKNLTEIIANAPPLVEEKDKDWPDFPFTKSDPGLGYGKATKQKLSLANSDKPIIIRWLLQWDFKNNGNRFEEVLFDIDPKDGSGLTP